MNWIVALIIGIIIGSFVSFITLSIIIVGSNSERMENAYKRGFEAGKKTKMNE